MIVHYSIVRYAMTIESITRKPPWNPCSENSEQMERLKAVRETCLTDAVLLGKFLRRPLARRNALGLPWIASGKTDWMILKSMNSGTRRDPPRNRRRCVDPRDGHADSVFGADTPQFSMSDPIPLGPGIADNAIGLAAVVGLPRLLEHLGVRLKDDLLLLANVSSLGGGNLEGGGPSSKPSSDRFEREFEGRSDPGTAQLFGTRYVEAKSPFEYRAITTGKDSVQPVQSVT